MSGANGSGDRTQPPPQAAAASNQGRTTAKDEDSGLIDIKNMARSTRRRVTARHSTQSDAEESLLVSSRPSALRDVVLPEPGKEQPVELAAVAAAEADAESAPERKGGSSWLLAVAALVLIGGGAAAYFATRGGGSDADTKLAANEAHETAAAPAAASGGIEAPPAEAPAEPGALVDDDGIAGDETGEGDDSTDDQAGGDAPADDDGAKADDDAHRGAVAKAGKRDGKRNDGKDRARKDDSASHKDEPKAKDDGKADEAPKKPKGQDLDSLLDFAAGDAAKKKDDDGGATEEKKVAAKKKLSRADVQDGMRSVTARVAACYERFKQPGTVKVKVTISNTGVVTKAVTVGSFANTDTGACVSKAVSQATFPEFAGAPMSLTYPFLLQ